MVAPVAEMANVEFATEGAVPAGEIQKGDVIEAQLQHAETGAYIGGVLVGEVVGLPEQNIENGAPAFIGSILMQREGMSTTTVLPPAGFHQSAYGVHGAEITPVRYSFTRLG